MPAAAIRSASADWPHVPWPWSVPFYTFGAIFLEFLLRLGALCILVWLIHVVILQAALADAGLLDGEPDRRASTRSCR